MLIRIKKTATNPSGWVDVFWSVVALWYFSTQGGPHFVDQKITISTTPCLLLSFSRFYSSRFETGCIILSLLPISDMYPSKMAFRFNHSGRGPNSWHCFWRENRVAAARWTPSSTSYISVERSASMLVPDGKSSIRWMSFHMLRRIIVEENQILDTASG